MQDDMSILSQHSALLEPILWFLFGFMACLAVVAGSLLGFLSILAAFDDD